MTQAEFRAALLDPGRPAPAGLTDPQGRPAGRRFDVYRNNVVTSLTEAMRAGFPAIRSLVGDTFFTAMAQVFVRAHPPASRLMMLYGGPFPGFLETFEPASSLPYLPDVARLELALRESYHAADATPLAPAALAELGPDRLAESRLGFAPAMRLLRSSWPVATIHAAALHGGPPPEQWHGEDVLIVRPDLDPEALILPPGAGPVLAALIAGIPLSRAAGPGCDLTALFALLLAKGCIIGAHIGD